MVGKRILMVVIAVLLCSCVTVTAFADGVSQYSDTGGYDENPPLGGVHGEEIVMLTTPDVYHAPLIDPLWYQQVEVCPHCRATGSVYIGTASPVSGYTHMFCRRCSVHWLPTLGGMYMHRGNADLHLHYLGDGVFCPYTVGIHHGYDYTGSGSRTVQFYCHRHDVLSIKYSTSIKFEFNTLWGLHVVNADEWVQPTPKPHPWITPFVPPYNPFETFEPVNVENIGNKVNDMSDIVKVVYKGFPYFVTLLAIAIACSFIIVVIKG